MASDGPSDLQNAVIKTQTAALGFRVKSGRAAVVLLTLTTSVAARLKQSSDGVKRAIQDLGRSAPAKGRPWRAEQKVAALAALFALR